MMESKHKPGDRRYQMVPGYIANQRVPKSAGSRRHAEKRDLRAWDQRARAAKKGKR